jgi:DNA invertase Pin-like site-specific DNA recombinase
MFNIIGAMAEFERELIRERVKAGLRNAKAKGKRLGRPRKNVDVVQICQLRSHGLSIRGIAADLGLSLGVVHGSLKQRS